MVDFHPKISRYLYQSVMGNSNDNITKYEYVNSLVYQSETFAGVQKETPVGTGRTLWWKFCWVHRFCSVPKASFLLRNQWAFRSCQAQERRPGGSSISTRYGAPKRPKIHWGFTKPPMELWTPCCNWFLGSLCTRISEGH